MQDILAVLLCRIHVETMDLPGYEQVGGSAMNDYWPDASLTATAPYHPPLRTANQFPSACLPVPHARLPRSLHELAKLPAAKNPSSVAFSAISNQPQDQVSFDLCSLQKVIYLHPPKLGKNSRALLSSSPTKKANPPAPGPQSRILRPPSPNRGVGVSSCVS